MQNFKLNDGNSIPAIGFGVFMVEPNGPTYDAVKEAIQAGYRHIDTAAAYFNEADVGKAVKSIGVSNMTPKLWNEFIPQFDTVPAVNQVECNPFFQQKPLRELLGKQGVRVEAWYPLGHGSKELLEAPAIQAAAEKYGKNAGQVILRFEVQEGIIALPKSTNPQRIAGNLDIFDFTLTDAEMDAIRALDTGKGSHDPEAPGVGETLLANYKIH